MWVLCAEKGNGGKNAAVGQFHVFGKTRWTQHICIPGRKDGIVALGGLGRHDRVAWSLSDVFRKCGIEPPASSDHKNAMSRSILSSFRASAE
jgi:hypothetical protein